jgi:hypothetical protein
MILANKDKDYDSNADNDGNCHKQVNVVVILTNDVYFRFSRRRV